jgi:cell division septal protein FtsQ
MRKNLLIFINYIVFFIFLFLVIFIIRYNDYVRVFVKENLQNKGFKIEEIHISDLKNLDVKNVVDRMDFSYGDAIFDVDLEKNRKSLEEEFWVESAKLKIIFPNIIDVQIEERIPKFVWFNKNYFLINDRGEILKKLVDSDLDSYSSFITLVGEDANFFVPNLLEFIEYDMDIYSYISAIELVNKRRWNIKFINDMVVQLPYFDPIFGWEKFVKLNEKLNIINNGVKNIDLRVKDKIFIELDLDNSLNKKILRQIG